MRTCDLKEVTGKELKKWWEWLVREQEGCCSVHFASTEKYRYCVCMGWRKVGVDDGPGEWRTCGAMRYQTMKSHEEWRIYWKIGRQTHNNIMQTDLDLDFEMPFVTEAMAEADPELCAGEVDDTSEEVECVKIMRKPFKYCGKIWHPWRWSVPKGYRDWNALAAHVRKTARRVWRDWKDKDDDE